jgi:hypothetical protein
VAIAGRLADAVSRRAGIPLGIDDLLIDAPPTEREVEFRLMVRDHRRHPTDRQHTRVGIDGPTTDTDGFCWRGFEELSPVVRSLAHEQFDDLVKRVRIFAPESSAEAIAGCPGLEGLILEAAGQPQALVR